MHIADALEMEALGARLAGAGVRAAIVGLRGDLGTGKTTLVRGWLRALGVTGPIRSPTFTLVEPYEVCEGRVYHFDLYRLSEPEELEYLGARDYFAEDSLCLIEWPERGKGWLPVIDLNIHIAFDDKGEGRQVRVISRSARAERVFGRLFSAPPPK